MNTEFIKNHAMTRSVKLLVYSDAFMCLVESAVCTSRINMGRTIGSNECHASGQINKSCIALST